MNRICYCRTGSCTSAVAIWTARTGHSFRLCQLCLDAWFDNADDDPALEPVAWRWLPTEGTAA